MEQPAACAGAGAHQHPEHDPGHCRPVLQRTWLPRQGGNRAVSRAPPLGPGGGVGTCKCCDDAPLAISAHCAVRGLQLLAFGLLSVHSAACMTTAEAPLSRPTTTASCGTARCRWRCWDSCSARPPGLTTWSGERCSVSPAQRARPASATNCSARKWQPTGVCFIVQASLPAQGGGYQGADAGLGAGRCGPEPGGGTSGGGTGSVDGAWRRALVN